MSHPPSFLLRRALAVTSLAALAACAGTPPATVAPSYFLSVQDGRAGLDDGKPVVRDAADRLAVIELTAGRLRLYRYAGGTLADTGERLQLDAAPAALKPWR